jgi:hypothetical protein
MGEKEEIEKTARFVGLLRKEIENQLCKNCPGKTIPLYSTDEVCPQDDASKIECLIARIAISNEVITRFKEVIERTFRLTPEEI